MLRIVRNGVQPDMWTRYKRLLCVALHLIASVVIVYFMPHEHSFSYDYSEGKPWKYSQLIAEYNFPVYKSDAQLKHERDSVLGKVKPFFNLEKDTERDQLHKFNADLAGRADVPDLRKAGVLVAKLLTEVYDRGIVSQASYNAAVSGAEKISVVSNSAALSVGADMVFSPRMAYEYIAHKVDSIHLPKEILDYSRVADYLVPNLVYDKERTESVRREVLANVALCRGMVQKGEKIIGEGEIVTPNTVKVLRSLERESEKRSGSGADEILVLVGQFLCVAVLMSVFLTYIMLYRRDYIDGMRPMLFLLSLILVFSVATSYVQQSNEQNVYVVPFAIVAIFVRVFLDSRTAFVMMLLIIGLCSLSIHGSYEFMMLEIVSSLTAIYSLKELTSRSQLFRSAALVIAVTALIKLGYDLSQGFFLSTLDVSWYMRIAVNGVLLLFAYPLMLLFEKVFGFISSVTLVELSNVNTPLLRRLSKEAQGTFNHSMQVANLATEVASKLDANVQLVRTAALYHDIGKLANPVFFTENQIGVNPHNDLPEEQSAQIIIRHVTDGVDMADKYGLPSVIRECIATHHGRGKTRYFYINYVNKHPGEPVNEELFTYPGPNPHTKEQAILMMADAVEAASRSMAEISEESLRKLVDNIVDQQVNEGFFRDCPITFRDVAVAKDVLVANLKTVYHTRISYPTLNVPSGGDTERGYAQTD